MAKKQDFTPLTYKKVRPEIDQPNYLFSKRQSSNIKKKPEWDIARAAPEADLVAKKRALYEIEQKLLDKRMKAKEIKAIVDGKWKELEEKEYTLRDNFIKFTKFVKENQGKAERAEHHLNEALDLIKKRNEGIDVLQIKYDHMTKIRVGMEENIQNHTMYEEYLTAVTKYPLSSFKYPSDTLDRYEALMDAKKHLAEGHKAALKSLELTREEMLRNAEEKSLLLMRYNCLAQELESRYATAKAKACQWEALVVKIKDTSNEKLAELHQVKCSCWNVYLQMCKRKEIEPELKQGDIANQLLFIKQTLYELRKITKIAKRRAVRDGIIKGDLYVGPK